MTKKRNSNCKGNLRCNPKGKSKKAQMEIMGLVVVVMLLSLGMIFVLKFVIMDESADVRRQHSESQLSANLLNALLQTTATDCGNQQIKTLFRDCAITNEIVCDDGFTRSCEYLQETLQEILDKTLTHWGKDFYFNSTETDTNYPGGIGFGSPCPGAFDSKFYPIQAHGRTVVVTLEVCGLEIPS